MSTPVQIRDAVEAHIPFRYRAEVATVFAQLKSDAPVVRDAAIVQGHAVASQLKAIAESQATPGMYSDAEPSACLKVANYLYAAMDVAREKAPSPYPVGTVNDAASLSDSGAAYQAMVAHDSNAWRSTATQPHIQQSDSSQPAQLGDSETEWKKAQERDRNAWKQGAQG